MTPLQRKFSAAVFGIGLLTSGPAAAEEDYSGYRVLHSEVLDLVAGPANTAALLSPDGSRLLHLGTSNICLLAFAETVTPSRLNCTPKTPDQGLRAPEDMLWSPSGDRLVMPT